MNTTLAHLLLALAGPAAQDWQQPGTNETLRSMLVYGVSTKVWAKLDVVAAVRVTGHRRIHPPGSYESDFWDVAVLSSPDGTGSPTELVQPGAGPYGPALEVGRSYLLLGTMPKDGFEVDLFETNFVPRARTPGQAWPRWALPLRGRIPKSGGTKEEWFGRAILSCLEGDPQVYRQGLEEFFEYTHPAVLGLTELAAGKRDDRWFAAGFRPNEFVRGLLAWGDAHGPAERLFAVLAAQHLGVNGLAPLAARREYEFAALDRDPPEGSLYEVGQSKGLQEMSLEDVPAEWRATLLGEFPSAEQWLVRLLSLKNPRAQHRLLLSAFEGTLDYGQNRRLSALLASPVTEVRYTLCWHFWATEAHGDKALEPLRRSAGLDNRLPDDYPRLDEHVAYWRAFYR